MRYNVVVVCSEKDALPWAKSDFSTRAAPFVIVHALTATTREGERAPAARKVLVWMEIDVDTDEGGTMGTYK